MTAIKRGMVLAAGLGTRLLPITEKLPKPLVPVLNVPNIVHTLYLMKRAGITDVILNLHHLPDVMERFLGNGSQWGVRLSYSREATLLGTGGGLKKCEAFFAGEGLVLANCDFISDVDLRPIIHRHLERGAAATMVLHQDEALQPLYSKVGTTAADHLCSLPSRENAPPQRTGIFTGIHVLSNEVFQFLKEVPSGINDVLYPKLMTENPRRIFGEYDTGAYWFDTGERATLWSASLQLLAKLTGGHPSLTTFMTDFAGYARVADGVWMPRGEKPPTGKLVPPLVVGKNCRVADSATLGPNTVIGEESEVGENARAMNLIALPSAQIPANRVSENSLQFGPLTLPAKKL